MDQQKSESSLYSQRKLKRLRQQFYQEILVAKDLKKISENDESIYNFRYSGIFYYYYMQGLIYFSIFAGLGRIIYSKSSMLTYLVVPSTFGAGFTAYKY